MKIAVFDTHRFEREYFDEANRKHGHQITYFDVGLSEDTAPLAFGYDVVSPFLNDCVNESVLKILKLANVKLIALRSVGVNRVDLDSAFRMSMRLARVPRYSSNAIAEHAAALVLALNRKIYRAYSHVREGNFSLDGLMGFDMAGKTVGVVGTGRIGSVFAKIMNGFSCNVVAYDIFPDYDMSDVNYELSLHQLCEKADVISLHLPLNPATRHIIGEKEFGLMKTGVMLINTGRGALIDTRALIGALKSGKVGYAGLDVYEEEENVFFKDLSDQVLQDDVLARLITFPNVIITSHQAFLTKETMRHIASETLQNVTDLQYGRELTNEIRAPGPESRVA